SVRFYGFGNETVALKPDDAYRVRQGQYLIAPSLVARSRQARFSVGPVFKFAHTARTAGSFVDSVRPYGSADFLQVGAQAQFRVDGRDRARAPSRGALLALGEAGILQHTTWPRRSVKRTAKRRLTSRRESRCSPRWRSGSPERRSGVPIRFKRR